MAMDYDFILRDRGSLWILSPQTEEAKQWCAEHLPEDAMMCVVVLEDARMNPPWIYEVLTKQWCAEHLPEDATTWVDDFVVKPRYVADILRGIRSYGLSVVRGA